MSFLKAGLVPRTVHIVLSDSGWILEELARNITARLPYVSASLAIDTTAAIQYYMTYSTRKTKVSPIEMALFTHREEDARAAALFDEVAASVDHAVSMSNATDRLIAGLGVETRSCISPGVDLERFRPSLKIGVVGRTYHTGRKGEALVSAVMDIDDIDWHFTGEGWPGPALKIDSADLPAFYRSMDYILAPATNEGGPMSVVEALAVGTPVIASDVGWVKEFPHIPFERGNAQSLREVLTALRKEKFALSETVAGVTWDNWAQAHDVLFRRLLAGLSEPGLSLAPAMSRRVRSVGLMTHGLEDTTLGGPSLRVPRTALEMLNQGIHAKYSHNSDDSAETLDVVHAFNIWAPLDAVRLVHRLSRISRPIVFSPILLDFSEAAFWQVLVLKVFRQQQGSAEAEIAIETAFARFKSETIRPFDPEPGYIASLCHIAENVDAFIFLSQRERVLFETLTGRLPPNAHIVHNPVDATQFDGVSIDLFRDTYGLSDYVLCVGRIEHRKNQLLLATALAQTELPLVLIGHTGDHEYEHLVVKFGGSELRLLGRMEPGSPMLRSAIAGARVFALPSWAEGAPLAALEAAAAGVPLVVSDRSGELEYFGKHARYCDPGSPSSIRHAVLEAWDDVSNDHYVGELRKLVANAYSWDRHIKETLAVYESVGMNSAVGAQSTEALIEVKHHGIIFDVTTWLNNSQTQSGIVRVESAIARVLTDQEGLPVCFVAYTPSGRFAMVPREVIESGVLGGYGALLGSGFAQEDDLNVHFAAFSDLVTVGSSWMQNSAYAGYISTFARRHNFRLSILMHDLTPYLFPYWYVAGYAEKWVENCRQIVARTHRILVYSKSTEKDVRSFCWKQEVNCPQVEHIRLADEIGDFQGGEPTQNGLKARIFLKDRPFVLAVGGIHIRKNYSLIYDVWTLLHEDGADSLPQLVIVGGVAWNGNDIARAMREDHRVKHHIHILEDIDDSSLAWLYEHCLLTVYPSLYEGWGLPVGESLARGKICISSSSSSMCEIAPSLTDLLPPLDRAAWAARIRHYVRSASARTAREAKIRAEYSITTWAETTRAVRSALNQPVRLPRPDLYIPGAIATMASAEGRRYLADGWFTPENWGVWSGGRISTLKMRLPHVLEDDLVLTILGRIFKPASEARRYTLLVNGITCGTIEFPNHAGQNAISVPLVSRVRVPREAVGDLLDLEICLQVDALCRVQELNSKSADTRALGLGLVAFMLQVTAFADDAARLFSTRPDVREMLGIPVDQDLVGMLTDNVVRPSIRMAVPVDALSNFVRVGTPISGGGVTSHAGAIAVALGTARMHLGRDVSLGMTLRAAASSSREISTSVFVNDVYLTSCRISPNVAGYIVTVAPSVLGKSDPLRISLICDTSSSRTDGNFILTSLSLTYDDAASVELPLGSTLSCSAKTHISVICPQVRAESLIIMKTTPRVRPKLATQKSEEIKALPLEYQTQNNRAFTIFSIEEHAGHRNDLFRINFGSEDYSIFIGDNSYTGKDIEDTQEIYHVFLEEAPFKANLALGGITSTAIAWLEGWLEVDGDQSRWSGQSLCSILIRAGSCEIALLVQFISDPLVNGGFVVTVDHMPIQYRLEAVPETTLHVIKFMVLQTFPLLHIITVSRLPIRRPVDLGLNADERLLSMRIIDFGMIEHI